VHQLEFGCLFRHGKEEVDLVLPVDSFLDHVADQFCLSQKRFGWFHGEQFPIEKFFSPFFLRKVRMEASGRATFQGTFDERYLVISYEGENFCLESPHFYLKADRIEKEISKAVGAVHYIDLKTWDHVGFLPLKEASYYQKKRDLLFTNAQAIVHFENKSIHIQDVEAYWNQLALKGEIEIETRARDDVDLMMRAHYLEGPASDAQQLLSHFSDSILWEIPFKGVVSSIGDVLSLKYHFTPKAELVSRHVQGDFQGYFEKPHLECSGHVTYDLKEITLAIESSLGSFHGLIAETISLEGEGISFHADKLDKGLHIRDFAYGSWQGKGDLEWDEKEIEIQNLVICDEEQGQEQRKFVFSGTYNRDQKVLRGDVESFEWIFGETLSLWKPKGEIFGSGNFEWTLSDGLQANLAASVKQLEFGGIHFGDREDLSCYYSSKQGISVEGLEVEIPTGKGVEKYRLGRFSYDLKHQKILFEGFDFSLPPERLPWIAELAGNLFPGKVHPTTVDWVEAIKQNEPLEGRISLEVYPDNIWVNLSLKDGSYYFSDKQFHLKNFLLFYNPLELNIWTKVFYRDNYHWVHLLTDSKTMSHGTLAISERELSLNSPAGYDSLVADWERQRGKGWCVSTIQGNFHGVHMNLRASTVRDFSDQIELEGQIDLDANRVYSLLGGGLTRIMDRLSILGGYTLEGAISIPKSDFSKFSFSGKFTGSDFRFAGVELASLSSDLSYHPDHISFSDLCVKDWAGQLSIGQADFMRRRNKWMLQCDNLTLEDVRISRLKSPWTQWKPKDKPLYRSLFIRNLDLNHLQANLDDLTSLQGSGILEFTNLPKRTLFTNLLFIPTEITARIGLDLTSLIPVRGTIDYEIKEGKIYFNEFKNMFTNGKRSRFYLAEGTTAYVDFDGNLNMKLKMKQYSLLMKLAEFFTISVKGTLRHPTYTLSNQFEDD